MTHIYFHFETHTLVTNHCKRVKKAAKQKVQKHEMHQKTNKKLTSRSKVYKWQKLSWFDPILTSVVWKNIWTIIANRSFLMLLSSQSWLRFPIRNKQAYSVCNIKANLGHLDYFLVVIPVFPLLMWDYQAFDHYSCTILNQAQWFAFPFISIRKSALPVQQE